MGVEIERKFLVSEEDFFNIEFHEIKHIKQGYLLNTKEKSVRVRSSYGGVYDGIGYITVKAGTGLTKQEYETSMPVNETDEMLETIADDIIEKKRCIRQVSHDHYWEVDYFLGDNKGLIVAEIELKSEDEEFELPEWCGEEVTYDERYINANLIKNPYKEWK